MESIWVLCGVIVGWISVDFILTGICRLNAPIAYNIGSGFVGGVIVYELIARGVCER